MQTAGQRRFIIHMYCQYPVQTLSIQKAGRLASTYSTLQKDYSVCQEKYPFDKIRHKITFN